MTKKNNERRKKVVPFNVILEAKAGIPEAIMAVVKHYESFINVLAQREIRCSDGSYRKTVDPDVRDELLIKLMQAIKAFKIYMNDHDVDI